MDDLNGHAPMRMHEVGSYASCSGCGVVMKEREWAAFAQYEKDQGRTPCKGARDG